MFLWPSKPREISDPDKLIETLRDLKKLDNYRVQIKKNGSRAIVWIDENSKVTIYDRRNTTLTMAMEKDWSALGKIFPARTLLDGELIGRKQGEISNRLYLWDMPVCGGTDLTKVSYNERYQELISLFVGKDSGYELAGWTENHEWFWRNYDSVIVGIAKVHPAENWKNLLMSVNYQGSTGENEGIVFKDITHPLSWDRSKTRDIKEQVKFLLKYMKR